MYNYGMHNQAAGGPNCCRMVYILVGIGLLTICFFLSNDDLGADKVIPDGVTDESERVTDTDHRVDRDTLQGYQDDIDAADAAAADAAAADAVAEKEQEVLEIDLLYQELRAQEVDEEVAEAQRLHRASIHLVVLFGLLKTVRTQNVRTIGTG